MNRYINSADALHTLKHLAYETALNQHDPYVADVFEDIAKNRLETWVNLIPTADVVEKERYDRLLENANILADAVRKYQTADVVERKKGKWYKPKEYPRDSYRFICDNCQDVAYFVTGNNGKKQKEDHPKCGYRYCPNCGADMRGSDNDR